jgi:hypothetical protein
MQNLDKLKKNLSTQWATQSCRVPLLFFKGEKFCGLGHGFSNGYLRRKKALASSCNCHFLPLEQNKNKEEE